MAVPGNKGCAGAVKGKDMQVCRMACFPVKDRKRRVWVYGKKEEKARGRREMDWV